VGHVRGCGPIEGGELGVVGEAVVVARRMGWW